MITTCGLIYCYIGTIPIFIKDDCESSDDCNNGACIEFDKFSYPRKMCFCNPGWFG